ncbi:MAG: hypothetical protein P8Y54_04395 [Xanthomonadales bacterium]
MFELNRWRWLGIEFTVIVLGILSALFVDTSLQDRQDAQREAVYRERVALDLQRDIANLDAVIDYYGKIRAHGLATLADLDGERRLDDLQLLFSAFNAAEEWGFILESATFEDMQSTGGLALIRDVQLRLDLADYYRQGASRDDVWRLPRAYRERVRGIIPNALQAAIHERCQDDDRASRIEGLSGDVPGSYWSANVLPTVEPLTASAAAQSVCGLDAGEFRTADAAAAVRADTELPRLLRYRVSQVRVAIALFAGQREMAEELLGLLARGASE